MKAVILAGGYGTRLRPLTLTQPKPLVEFANKPMVLHHIEALSSVGVDTVILAVSYKREQLENEIIKHTDKLGVKIIFSVEETPLDTAGPLALAKNYLNDGEPFFVLNSDVICDFDFQAMMEFHQTHGKEGTIAVTQVNEPSKYGVVVYKKNTGEIEKFVEKPQEYVGNKINAGMYILNSTVLDRIELKPTSIEKEVFPQMCETSNLYAFVLKGYWMDVGQPIDFLKGTQLYLDNQTTTTTPSTSNLIPPVLIHESVKIPSKAVIGPHVVIAENVIIEEGVRIKNSTILPNTILKQHCFINTSIIGRKCIIGQWVRIENTSVIGDEVKVNDEIYLNGARVCHNKTITENVLEPKVVM
uniref:Mannose-1-phosphate guanylyltransferase n=1 Tax=Panagrolaimus sp. PS1159 TaxID=55785 RepID=A0AC35F077_9BILA